MTLEVTPQGALHSAQQQHHHFGKNPFRCRPASANDGSQAQTSTVHFPPLMLLVLLWQRPAGKKKLCWSRELKNSNVHYEETDPDQSNLLTFWEPSQDFMQAVPCKNSLALPHHFQAAALKTSEEATPRRPCRPLSTPYYPCKGKSISPAEMECKPQTSAQSRAAPPLLPFQRFQLR